MTQYEQKFRDILAEILQLDQAELDFGIYRIMNQKRKDIEAFLNNRLVPEVTKILKAQTAAGTDISAMENEVFSHLAKFFSRYYEGGDFISKRRYKDDAYAIPYSGEEVKLYWANADQYYIKTSEYFKNYSFVLPTSRRKVHFVLRDADTEQNNNKAANNMERRFQLCEEDCIAEEDGELNIFFTYELMPKTTKQDALVKDAEAKIVSSFAEGKYADFAELVNEKVPTEKNKERTLLMKHLQDYTAKNNFDYFIHKDLGGFLRRELDFYIKNEVMFLDDLDATHIMEHLAQVKAIKQVGEKIITFLAQLEDFQKKLWLKKKFVVGCDYCITLDRIPRTLYPEIIANDEQREEWVRLFAIDEIKGDMMTEGYSEPLTEKFLEDNPFLVLDTKFFSSEFKHKLVGSMEKVDEECNGLLINSENFQALELLQEKYRKGINCFYFDPPYNAPSSLICYKNNYKDSSWISMMDSRLELSKELRGNRASYSIAIDKWEHNNLYDLCKQKFADSDVVDVAVEHNKKGTMGDHFSYSNEYAIFVVSNNIKYLNEKIRDRKDWEYSNLRNWGGESLRGDAANCFYPIYIEENEIIGFGKVCENTYHPKANEFVTGLVKVYVSAKEKPQIINADEREIMAIYPIDNDGVERKWRYAFQTIEQLLPYLQINLPTNSSNSYQIFMPKRSDKYKTMWYDSKYNAGDNGTTVLTNMGLGNAFTYPKSVYLVKDCISAISNEGDVVMDIFAGSGTTGHSILMLNREAKAYQKLRKCILVEMGLYFNTATKPRIEKVIYSEDWKDGKPVSRKGISQCFKYIRLEQYEDTLNNLQPKNQRLDFDNENGKGDFEETYFLRYMLDTETKGDLFNLEWFKNPFAMSIKTTKDNELVDTHVDMVETFNYLIGLNVETLRYPKDGYCVVEGTTHIGNERTLVIWRNCNKVSNEDLNEFFRKQAYCTTDSEFDKIYVNGDNTLPNIKADEEHWKVVLIEEEFKKRMFE